MTHTPNPYHSLDDAQYDAVVNGQYLKSTFSNANAGCLSFTVADGSVGFQDDKLPPAERKARTLIFDQQELAVFIAGAKTATSTTFSTNSRIHPSKPFPQGWREFRPAERLLSWP